MGLPPENTIDIGAALRHAGNDGPIWSVNSEQLNVNLLRLPTGDGVAEHVNNDVDVVLIVFEGNGELTVMARHTRCALAMCWSCRAEPSAECDVSPGRWCI
jgi:hypothetical protein